MSLLSFDSVCSDQNDGEAVPLLTLENVSVRLGSRLVIDSLSLRLLRGDNVRILGPNGAGKTTLLNAIMGLLPLCEGKISFRGNDLTSVPTHERARLGIAYVRQRDNVFPSLSVEANLRLALGPDGWERFRESFSAWAESLPPARAAGMLSGGQKQQLAWGMAVLSPHELLLADEPTAGVALSETIDIADRPSALWVSHSIVRTRRASHAGEASCDLSITD